MSAPDREPAAATGPALTLTASKRFGDTVALDGAHVAIARGTVHALCGENGAGKSTLMRIGYGLLAADRGELIVDGPVALGRWDVATAQARGIGMVHQHGMLVPTLTLAENAALGHERVRGGGVLDLDAARTVIRKAGERLELELPVDRLAGHLTVGEQQRAEIALVASRSPRLLILDEPTALLAPVEVGRLLELLRVIARGGGAVVLVTHKLDEVVAVADAITVLRAGRTVAELPRGTSAPLIARAMVGELPPPPSRRGRGARASDLGTQNASNSSAARRPPPAARRPMLRVRRLVAPGPIGGGVADLDLDVAAGEIVGVAGVEGNGQRELVLALAGLATPSAGVIELDGVDVARTTVAQRRGRGLAFIPEDRHRHGLVLDASIADNVALGRLGEVSRRGLVDRTLRDRLAARLIAELDVRPGDPALPTRALSGGNQQKLVIARELDRPGVRMVLAAQPTRGVDLAAVQRIHARLLAAAEAGAGVLVVSADLDELLALCDRIVVMHRGHLAGEVGGDELTAAEVRMRIGAWMVGAAPSSAEAAS